MIKPKTIIVISIVLLVIIILIWFFYYRTINNKNTENNMDKKEEAGICDPASGYYKMPSALGLPQVQFIPGFRNRDSLVAFLQNEADEFSWKTFIALNWPANQDGSPDTKAALGSNSQFSVFEHWMPSTGIYRARGGEPKPWNYRFLHKKENANPEEETELRIIPELKSFSRRNADNEHLIDQNGNYTYYQVYYNRQAYDYVVNGKLYNKKGQEEFAKNWPSLAEGLKVTQNGEPFNIEKTYKRLYFPVGNFKDSTLASGDKMFYFTINPGAVIIKTAWRVLTDQDDKSRYYIRKVKIAGNETKELGLVGMHFIHKVSEATQWVWSTFEQVDNDPQLGIDKKVIIEKGIKYSYFNPNNPDTSSYNKVTDIGVEMTKGNKIPMQVVRVLQPEPNAEKLNGIYHDRIRKSDPKAVWQYYKLVGTQWPFTPDLFTAGSNYTPNLLANTVLETSNQSTSSCMGCHSKARFLYNDTLNRNYGYNSDFVWGLANVRK